MNKKFEKAVQTAGLAPGVMKAIEINGNEIIVCNNGGKFYSVQRRCGHMNTPLELGTLDGNYLTCPMHCTQFDITTGEAISGPVPPDISREIMSPKIGKLTQNISKMTEHVDAQSIRTFETKVDDGWVLIAI